MRHHSLSSSTSSPHHDRAEWARLAPNHLLPVLLTAAWAKGGDVLEPKIESTQYHTNRYGNVNSTNAVAVRGKDGSVSVFVTNRSLDDGCDFEIKLPEGFTPTELDVRTLHDDDMLATNTVNHQDRVVPHPNDTASIQDGMVTVTLPPVSDRNPSALTQRPTVGLGHRHPRQRA